jgi:hypothetical protein
MSKLAIATPLSSERKKRARAMLMSAQRFSTIKTVDETDFAPEPTDYEATQAYKDAIGEYFNYHIDYYPLFANPGNPLSPSDWVYFADINDEITEQKFKRDQDIRAFITAFRFAIINNRRGIIFLKRIIQAIVVAAVFGLALALVQQGAPWPPKALAMVLIAVALFALFGGGFYQNIRGSQLQSVIDASGKTLANALQEHVNKLTKNFIEFLADIDREEASEDMTDPEWTNRSAWWMILSMWVPKRIEYIEKFLQSEMQRLRIFMLRSALVGYAAGFAVLFGFSLAAAVALCFMPSGWALKLAVWLLAFMISVAFSLYSLHSSMKLTDISAALGKEPLGKSSRFADIDLHEKLGEQIRRDKEKLRQHLLAGGYAQNRPPRHP